MDRCAPVPAQVSVVSASWLARELSASTSRENIRYYGRLQAEGNAREADRRASNPSRHAGDYGPQNGNFPLAKKLPCARAGHEPKCTTRRANEWLDVMSTRNTVVHRPQEGKCCLPVIMQGSALCDQIIIISR
jgi:hypothetical protein